MRHVAAALMGALVAGNLAGVAQGPVDVTKLGPQVGIRADVRGYGTQTDLVETGWGCGYYDCGVVSYEKTIWQGDATAGVFIAF